MSGTPIIYAPAAIGVRPTDQMLAWQAISQLDNGRYDLRRWTYPQGAENDTMYARGLDKIWREDADIIIVEHDMAPTTDMIDQLVECPHVACVQAYWISPTEAGRFIPRQNVGTKHPVYGQVLHREDNLFPTYADWAGPGLAKISQPLRSSWTNFLVTTWGDVERSLNRLVSAAGERWHVHLPVCGHHHGFHQRLGVARG